VWTSKEQPSRVLWQDLNASAQENVRALSKPFVIVTLAIDAAGGAFIQRGAFGSRRADPEQEGVVGRKKGNGGVWVYGLQWKSAESLPDITWEPFDDLDAVCQDMVLTAFPRAATERWRAKSKGKQKKRGKKKAIGTRSGEIKARKRRDLPQAPSAARGGKNPRPVLEDDMEFAPDEDAPSASPELTESLVAGVDEQWEACRKEHAEDTSAFPQSASAERIQRSLVRFRQMVSEPLIDQLGCAVCGELVFASAV